MGRREKEGRRKGKERALGEKKGISGWEGVDIARPPTFSLVYSTPLLQH